MNTAANPTEKPVPEGPGEVIATVLDIVTGEIDRFGFGRTADDVAERTGLPTSKVRETLTKLKNNGQVRAWKGSWSGDQYYARLMGSWPSLYRPHLR